MVQKIFIFSFLVLVSCNRPNDNNHTMSDFKICTNYSINEVFNDDVLENTIRLEFFNELSLEAVQNKGRPFVRLMFFDEADTCSIVSFISKDNCAIVEIKRSLPKYFNLINFEPGEQHNLYRTFEYEYSRKILNFYTYENVINLINNDFTIIPLEKPKRFVILEKFDGTIYKKSYSDKFTFEEINKFIETLK